jgi:hypothetical protein
MMDRLRLAFVFVLLAAALPGCSRPEGELGQVEPMEVLQRWAAQSSIQVDVPDALRNFEDPAEAQVYRAAIRALTPDSGPPVAVDRSP